MAQPQRSGQPPANVTRRQPRSASGWLEQRRAPLSAYARSRLIFYSPDAFLLLPSQGILVERGIVITQDSEGAKVGMQALPSWLAAAVGTAEVRLRTLL